MIFENSLPKGIFGKNIRDSPNGSLTTDSRSLQVAILKIKNQGRKDCTVIPFKDQKSAQ